MCALRASDYCCCALSSVMKLGPRTFRWSAATRNSNVCAATIAYQLSWLPKHLPVSTRTPSYNRSHHCSASSHASFTFPMFQSFGRECVVVRLLGHRCSKQCCSRSWAILSSAHGARLSGCYQPISLAAPAGSGFAALSVVCEGFADSDCGRARAPEMATCCALRHASAPSDRIEQTHGCWCH